jgi:hypothetical protein
MYGLSIYTVSTSTKVVWTFQKNGRQSCGVKAQTTALQQVGAALRANVLPGVMLWCGLAVLLLAYHGSPAFQALLGEWGTVKAAWGYPFSFLSYVVFAVLVPEALGHVLRRQPWTRRWCLAASASRWTCCTPRKSPCSAKEATWPPW